MRPSLPLIDVGNKERRFLGAINHEPHGFRILIAMWDQQGRRTQIWGKNERSFVFNGFEDDVPARDELAPGAVAFEKEAHARHGINADFASVHSFLSQVGETHIVANVCMGEQDAIWSISGVRGKAIAQMVQLPGQIGSGFHEELFLCPPIDQTKRDNRLIPLHPRKFQRTATAPATRVRRTAILGVAKDYQPTGAVGNGSEGPRRSM